MRNDGFLIKELQSFNFVQQIFHKNYLDYCLTQKRFGTIFYEIFAS